MSDFFDDDNSFDSLDTFGDDTDFGFGNTSSKSKGSNSNNDFEFDNSSGDTFGDSSNFDSDFNSNDGNDINYSEQFENTDNTDEEDTNPKSVTKTAIIIAVIGIAILVLVIIIAGVIRGKSSNNTNDAQVQSNVVSFDAESNDVVNTTTNNIASDNTSNTEISNTQNNDVRVINNYTDNGINWIELDGDQNVDFQDDYVNLTFTVTGINHYVRTTNANKDMVIKTVLSGSLSGLDGVYTLDVPYDKGKRLVVGNSFQVNVLLGSYGDKIVIGDIKY